MVVVHRFRWFGWFVLCVGVILGCYLMSSKVAAERNRLTDIEASIATTQRDIKALETEFDTRASYIQLQRWNGDTLKLSAPTAQQYVRDDAALAQADFNASAGSAPARSGIQTASIIPSAPEQPAPAGAPATPPAPSAPAKVTAAVAMVSAPAARAQPAAAKASVRPKAATVALLDRKLLSDSTMGSLNRGARNEGDR